MTMVTAPIAPPPPPAPARTGLPRWLTVLLAGLFAVVTVGVAVGSYIGVDTLLRGPGQDDTLLVDVAVSNCRITNDSYQATVRVRNRGPEKGVFNIRIRWFDSSDKVVAEDRREAEVPGGGYVLVEAEAKKDNGSGINCSAGLIT